MEMTKRLNSAELGFEGMRNCNGRENAGDVRTCDEALKAALRGVSVDSSRDEKEGVGAVLVFGESADDEALLIALREVLGEQFPNGDSVDLSRVRAFSPDPAFAGSRAMAKTVWEAHGSEQEGRYKNEL